MRLSTKFCIFAIVIVASRIDTVGAEVIEKVGGKNVAVVVYTSAETAERYEKTVQARIESILKDNGAKGILDEAKIREMKNVWRQLEDPSYFVTDEDFSKNTAQHEINTLVRAYLKAEVFPGLADYFSATAQVDLRLIDADADVTAKNSIPMGAPGCPPSDGLTKSSAIVNAVQRAVDDACIRAGLEVLAPVHPRGIPVCLKGPVFGNGVLPRPPENDESLWRLAKLDKMTWRKERVTCTARSPGGDMAAVGGYIVETNLHRRPERHYGSRIHLLDTKEGSEVNVFGCHELAFGGQGTRKVIACAFATNWRYLIAVTGRKVFIWDTQRGCLLGSLEVPKGVVPTSIEFRKTEGVNVVVVGTQEKRILVCQIERKK